jgi:hypothetical protein
MPLAYLYTVTDAQLAGQFNSALACIGTLAEAGQSSKQVTVASRSVIKPAVCAKLPSSTGTKTRVPVS